MKLSINRPFLALCLAVSALLSACGGGGGGAATNGILTVINDWTLHSSGTGVLGQSEKLDLTDANGFLVQEIVVNQDNPNLQTTTFSTHPIGTYHLAAQLWSQRDLGGVETGVIDATIVLTPTDTVRFDVGAAVTSVAVTPGSASLTGLNTQQFFAQAHDTAGNDTFVDPSSGPFTWQAFGGIGNITSGGLLSTVSSSSQLSGSVRATYVPNSALFGAAAVSVAPFVVTSSKWTVIVYMNAANDLDGFSEPNIEQMEKVSGTPANSRFIVQWKQAVISGESPTPSFQSTRRYLIAGGHRQLIQDLGQGVDMGSPQTMSTFVNWATTYFPSTRTCVVIWNHGNGWASGRALALAPPPTRGFSYDDDTGTHIDTWQLSQCFGTLHPDILAWDASLMQMIEVGYEVQSLVTFMVGSEESPPGPGYPYDLIFANFRDNPDASTLTLAKTFCDEMFNAYVNNTLYPNVTQSVFDPTQTTNLGSSISALADQLIANQASLTTLIPAIRANSQAYDDSTQLGRLYRDTYQISDLLITGVGGQGPAPTSVQTAAANVKTAVLAAIPYQRIKGSPGSHGISISFYDATTFSPLSASYSNLAFAKATHWPNWLSVSP